MFCIKQRKNTTYFDIQSFMLKIRLDLHWYTMLKISLNLLWYTMFKIRLNLLWYTMLKKTCLCLIDF